MKTTTAAASKIGADDRNAPHTLTATAGEATVHLTVMQNRTGRNSQYELDRGKWDQLTGNPLTVWVEVRDVYGKPAVYPADDAARTFAAIARTSTITAATMRGIRALGFTVEVTAGPGLPAEFR
jgi:hypothetical protein